MAKSYGLPQFAVDMITTCQALRSAPYGMGDLCLHSLYGDPVAGCDGVLKPASS